MPGPEDRVVARRDRRHSNRRRGVVPGGDGFRHLCGGDPASLGIGTVLLNDGSSAKGFLVEAVAVATARDATIFGGWRRFMLHQTAT